MHHDAITGTSPDKVAGYFNDKAKGGIIRSKEFSAQFLAEKVFYTTGLKTDKLHASLDYQATYDDYTSPYSHSKDFVVVIQNPNFQEREEMIELQLPFYNFTIDEVVDGELVGVKNFDKFLPKTLLNSNETIVKSYAKFPIKFKHEELAKAFKITNLGVIHIPNEPPASYLSKPQSKRTPIWNLNLPMFLQPHGWEIDNFQPNFKRVRDNSTIKAGDRFLTFNGIISAKNLPKDAKIIEERQSLAFKNATRKVKDNLKNYGAALFTYKDSLKGINQQFAFNLRNYYGEKDTKKYSADGWYQFQANGTKESQRSYPYSTLRRTKMFRRQNEFGGEFVFTWEKKYGAEVGRATARISLEEAQDFINFEVETNSVPIKGDQVGKDIVADWAFYNGFDTGNKIYVDANSLHMNEKTLNQRKEMPFSSDNRVASNMYPVTSAIAVRDVSKNGKER